ncbi:phage distal tail protein [Micromonospora sp. NPDC047730]|uniref:phage distal tail protein n=1 Tax=Micromonospora sp. NPDC047730 TaxID=3364253 RepID=UPI00371E72BA
MPLAVRAIQTLPPPVTPPVVTPPPQRPRVGTMRATWTDPNGTVWELTGPHTVHGWLTRPEIGGWGANPVTIVTDPLARGGVTVRHQRAEPRRLTWPLHIYGDTHLQFLDRYRRLMRAFTLTKYKGPGLLTVARPDGKARSIRCLLEDGWGGEPGENLRFANPVLTLFAPDGFWQDVEPQFVRRSYVGATVPYLSPYLTVSSSQILGESTINNPGDVEAWPSWKITGPATELVATNGTTGESFTLTHTLAAGQTATITIAPERTLVRGPAGENLIGSLNWPGAILWGLVPGVNDVNFEVNGSGAGTQVELSYFPRYETA